MKRKSLQLETGVPKLLLVTWQTWASVTSGGARELVKEALG